MKAFRLFCCALCIGALTFSTAAAGLVETREPRGLELPAEVEAVEGWSLRDGNHTLEAGSWGLLSAGAWFEANRPPRGEMVVLELEYLDNLDYPVRAEIYSGLGTTDPWSELHRFGGENDGRWKKARVPASADFIFLHLPDETVRFRLQSESGELTARSFRLVAALPDEEERWNRETRAWRERVQQQRAHVDPSYWDRAASPVLYGPWEDTPLVPYARNWMDLIMPVDAPAGGEAGAPLEAVMFMNEFETVQLGIYAGTRDLENVRVSMDPLVDPAGKTVATGKVRVAEYAKVHGYTMKSYFIEPFPQRLWPAYPFDVPEGRSHMVWINLRTEAGSAVPGRFTTTVRISADGVAEVTVPLTVEILPLRLLTMDEAGLKMGGCTTGLLPEFELDMLSDYNHNMINIWYQGVRPRLSRQGDTFAMDFRIMDEWMSASKRQGINDHVYFLGGNPYGFPQTMHLPRTLANTMLGMDDDGWSELAMRDPFNVPEEVAPLITEWSRRFWEHAGQEQWPNVILTPFDEPAKWHQYRSGMGMLHYIKPQFKQQTALIREGAPGALIYGSIHHYYGGIDFLPDVDVFCTNAVAEHWELGDEVRNAGKIYWEYSGGANDNGMPAVPRYTFGFYFAAHESVGSLCWAYNWGNRFDTLDGYNWLYAWNTPFDVIPAPYYDGMREAWDERRLLETIKRTAAKKNVNIDSFLGEIYARFASGRGSGGTSTLDDFWERATDEDVMELWHDQMVAKLVELQGM